MATKHQQFAAKKYRDGYQDALAAFAAILAQKAGDPEAAVAACNEWVANNRSAAYAGVFEQVAAEFGQFA